MAYALVTRKRVCQLCSENNKPNTSYCRQCGASHKRAALARDGPLAGGRWDRGVVPPVQTQSGQRRRKGVGQGTQLRDRERQMAPKIWNVTFDLSRHRSSFTEMLDAALSTCNTTSRHLNRSDEKGGQFLSRSAKTQASGVAAIEGCFGQCREGSPPTVAVSVGHGGRTTPNRDQADTG